MSTWLVNVAKESAVSPRMHRRSAAMPFNVVKVEAFV